MSHIDENEKLESLNIAVLSVSDTRKMADDRSGDILEERIKVAGHYLARRDIVPDEVAEIRKKVIDWASDPEIEIIITTGGTGFTGRDVTPEAIEPLFDKRMDGFSVMFHKVSYETIGMVTIQSRATAGLINGTFVFCLPGSTGACKDAWDNILKGELDSRQRPHNLVMLMPRLTER
ncbi:molybdenum cofactor biosynthesis protein B [uncultured Bartonella sp.]|uniref:molybdenum cofactor biosynthesis protein B n=1 Tax=uncultured Bartonella sp. TaxID=104108 RepID=UPI0026342300|nr:molybdenum cofactor biosynthesis protein B [uncultured Bartonella sp.]